VATPQLSERLERERIDVGFLPVNGADDTRRRLDIVGNMDVAAAAAFAARHRFGVLVPMHYDLYPNNGLTAGQFDAAWSAQPAAESMPLKIFRPGEHWTWQKA
jgi:L-ascorbate metabolism protein UlaG (beta-lactamase superfamily)